MLHSLSSIFLSSTTESGLCPASRRSSSASNRGTGSSVDSVPYSRFRCATSICCSACSSPNIAGAGALDTVAMTGRVVTVGLGTGAATGTELRPRELALVNPSEDLWKKSRGDPMLPSSSSSYQEGQQRAEVGNKNASPLPLLHRSPLPPYPCYRLGLEQRLWGLCLRVGRSDLRGILGGGAFFCSSSLRNFIDKHSSMCRLITSSDADAIGAEQIGQVTTVSTTASFSTGISISGNATSFSNSSKLKSMVGRVSCSLSLRMFGDHTLPSQALSFLELLLLLTL